MCVCVYVRASACVCVCVHVLVACLCVCVCIDAPELSAPGHGIACAGEGGLDQRGGESHCEALKKVGGWAPPPL